VGLVSVIIVIMLDITTLGHHVVQRRHDRICLRAIKRVTVFFLGQHIDVLYWVQDTQQNKSIKRRPNWRNLAL
jgi:hypothetical protein